MHSKNCYRRSFSPDRYPQVPLQEGGEAKPDGSPDEYLGGPNDEAHS